MATKIKQSTLILKEIEKLTRDLKNATKEENRWMRNLKHDNPSPVIKNIMIQVYRFGFYLSYSQLRTLEFWLRYEEPINPKFCHACVDLRIWKSYQTSRNEIVRLRKMGITVVKNKLHIIQVDRNKMKF